ncbi:relaxase, partial [Streptococcus pneumoniae]|nr:relaxase [Streptococcus pneumoniae]
NKGTILIPAHQIEKAEDGSYEIFIRKNDFYYFVNPEHADKNRYMKGETVASQLSYDNGEMIVRKHPKISSLDQLVREYN